MTNLYDSWRSDYNGYERNFGGSGYGYGHGGGGGSAYGGGHYGGSGYGGRRRSDYDTNFWEWLTDSGDESWLELTDDDDDEEEEGDTSCGGTGGTPSCDD